MCGNGSTDDGMTVYATKASEIQSQKTQNEKALKDVQSKISNLESQRSSLSSEVNSLNDSLTDTLLNIEVLESDLADKEVEIEQAQEDYEAAKATEDKQYASMKTRSSICMNPVRPATWNCCSHPRMWVI